MPFSYPPIPQESIDERHPPPPGSIETLMDIVIVQRTDSREWGDAATSSHRAHGESETTPANENLLRSYHPALAHFESVSVATEFSGNKIWIVASLPHTTYETHAAGREIHIVPYYLMPEYMHMYVRALHDPIPGCINPRKLLSAQDLEALRKMFPRAIGARLLISGFLIVLFKNFRDVSASWEQALGIEFGRMRIGYDVAGRYNPAGAEVIEPGDAVSSSAGNSSSAAALGLKLVLPNGQRAITVPTHAFVKVSTVMRSGLYPCIANWIACVKDALWKFNPFSGAASEAATGTMQSNSPVGKEVWLAKSNQLVGTITDTYDPPVSCWTPFPYGFRHDLSLVTGENLPDLTTPPSLPKVSGWGSYSDALDGRPIFVTRFNVTTGTIEKDEGTGHSQAQTALAVGSEYFWEKESCSQTVSILWRTRYGGDGVVDDFSGSVLCEGRPTDNVCRAVVFQNYEVPLRDEHESVSLPTVKGGSVLPSVIRESEIICDAQGQ
ncbi:hypothetical protein FQN51_001151 [Onygenales sp. PD_10]|nr:hypothetical protein FQN51_001151 [Onygenales sp. PD_10]